MAGMSPESFIKTETLRKDPSKGMRSIKIHEKLTRFQFLSTSHGMNTVENHGYRYGRFTSKRIYKSDPFLIIAQNWRHVSKITRKCMEVRCIPCLNLKEKQPHSEITVKLFGAHFHSFPSVLHSRVMGSSFSYEGVTQVRGQCWSYPPVFQGPKSNPCILPFSLSINIGCLKSITGPGNPKLA